MVSLKLRRKGTSPPHSGDRRQSSKSVILERKGEEAETQQNETAKSMMGESMTLGPGDVDVADYFQESRACTILSRYAAETKKLGSPRRWPTCPSMS